MLLLILSQKDTAAAYLRIHFQIGGNVMSDIPAPSPSHPLIEANLYSLSGRNVHVSFATTSISGRPLLTYQDPQRSLSFIGDQIQIAEVPLLGTVASVTLTATPDLGSTTFSLVLPTVHVDSSGASGGVPVRTIGITTNHKTSIAPGLNFGQQDFYSTTTLRGSASHVIS
jgi:hypothetical protein